MEGVSIVICCHNSAIRIENTLRHIAKQKIRTKTPIEIVIVDNNCTDNTVDLILNLWRELNPPYSLRIEIQKEPGLSAARYKGVLVSQFEYLIFCDDDNWLHEEYVENAYQLLSKNMDIGAACGYNIATSNTDFPNWFSSYQKYYAVGVPDLLTGDISHKGWIWGAGMVLRRSLLIKLYEAGFKNIASDRKGNELTTGGDVEICKWIILAEYKLWYSGNLHLHHFIPKERLTESYITKLLLENKKMSNLFETYDYLIREKKSPVSFISTIKLLLKLPYKLLLNKMSFHDVSTLNRLKFKLGVHGNSNYFIIKKSLKNFQIIKNKL